MRRRRLDVPVRFGWLAAALCWAGPCLAQAPAEAPPPADAPRAVAGLSTRFRFLERYDRAAETSRPEAIGQYRVAVRDTFKYATEKPSGAPDRQEFTRQTIYAERPALVNSAGAVEATVRRYETYRVAPDPAAKPSRPTPLEGLTLWFQHRAGQLPQVLSLSEGRSLRQEEFTAAVREIFVPALAAALPAVPTRTGDRWTISRAGIVVLLGMAPAGGARSGGLTGTLQQVRQAARGPDWEAVIAISGRVVLPPGETAVNARLVFAFPPPPNAEGKGEEATEPVDARGAIVDLRMATTVTTPLPPSGRLRRMTTRELVLVRKVSEPGEPLAVPEATPAATEENSWLTYDDRQGKFHFRYPQDFQLGREPDDYSIELARFRAGHPDTLELRRVVKSGDAEADRLNRDPELHVKANKESWRQDGFDVISGQQGWLPEAEWAEARRKVYRAESVLRGRDPSGKKEVRLNNELFFAQFGRDESLVVIATTAQDPPAPFRKQVEAIIRSYDFGPSTAR